MYICTLISSPQRAALEAPLADSLRNAWGGGDILWLAPKVALEFPIQQLPDNRWQVWEDLQKLGIDMNIQPQDNRCKKMLLADMDSTMIEQECIDELAHEAGVGEHVSEITAKAMNGELDFEGALNARVGLLEGLNAQIIQKVLKERITFMPGGDVLLRTMKANGAYCALVSGGFTAFSGAVADKLGFHEHRANALLVEDQTLTGKVALPILGKQAKVNALEEITAKLGISQADVLAVGDGANDLGMLNRAGSGVALHAKPAVTAQCDLRINHGDLSALLYLQGYSQDDFAHG